MCLKTGNDKNTVVRVLGLYERKGVEGIYQCERGRRPSRLDEIADELEKYFDENPPTDVPDAVRKIKEHFGINITNTPVRNWLKAKAIRIRKPRVYLQKRT